MTSLSQSADGDGRTLTRLVKQMTQTGRPQLDDVDVGQLKRLCRSNDRLVDLSVELIVVQMRRRHSEARLSAFQMVDVLFCRSHRFRELLLARVDEVVDLCLGSGTPGDGVVSTAMPPPLAAARRLKRAATSAVQRWHQQFATAYRKLDHLYSYLQQVHGIDFTEGSSLADGTVGGGDSITPQSSGNISSGSGRSSGPSSERAARLQQLKLEQVRREVSERRDDIMSTLTQMENCFSLLLPELDMFQECSDDPAAATDESAAAQDQVSGGSTEDAGAVGSSEDESEEGVLEPDMDDIPRGHGLLSARQCVQITLPARLPPPVTLSDDNAALVAALRELAGSVTRRHLPAVDRWLELAKRSQGEDVLVRQLTAVRDCLQSAMRRHQQLRLDEVRATSVGDSDSDHDDFIEVAAIDPLSARLSATAHGPDPTKTDESPTKTDESSTKTDKCPTKTDESAENEDVDVSSSQALLDAARRSANLRVDGCASIPDNSSACQQPQLEVSRVWRGCSERDASSSSQSSPGSFVAVTSVFRPVEHRCGAPMPSGRLCPRADRRRCPLHGLIVPRDQQGRPLDAALRRAEWERRVRGDDWQDPRLMAQLEAATGVDLRIPQKGRRRTRQSRSGLTNVTGAPRSGRQRLANKVFNQRSLRRVSSALDRLEARLRTR